MAEVRRSFQSVFDGTPGGPAPSSGYPRADDILPDGTSRSQAAAVARILSRASRKLASGPTSGVLPASEPERRTDRAPLVIALAGLAILLLLAAGLWNRYWDARGRVAAASAECLAREVEWTAISEDLTKALAVRSKIEKARSQLAHISADRAKPRWTSALRGIVAMGDAGIEILEVRARGETEDSEACEVRVSGVASGAAPRTTADRFRHAVEENLKTSANGRPVSARFEELGNGPGEVLSENQRASFVMMVTLGSKEPSAATRKEGR